MMKKTKNNKNYLEIIPLKNPIYNWTDDKNGIVTLEILNKGVMNRIAQKLLKKPKISYVHLDNFGSFVWLKTDGKRSIADIGALVEAEFGKEAHPLYERLAKFFMILESYGFVTHKTE